MEQIKALNALEPFLALSKSATSPIAAADLITRATSTPNTFIFSELLQTPQIQALANAPDHKSHLTILQIFSYGTYSTYKEMPDLPSLNEQQTLKLRQLSLLTLARDKSNLSYAALVQQLGLENTRELEQIVISAIYAGLITATLDPARQTVQVSSLAPLRDLAPGSVPSLLATLQAWSNRCADTLAELEAQIAGVRQDSAARGADERNWESEVNLLVDDERSGNDGAAGGSKRTMTLQGRSQARFGKRGSNLMMEGAGAANAVDAMEVSDDDDDGDGNKRASRRKL